MLIPDFHNDIQQKCLIELLSKLRGMRKDLGGYIEHYYHNEKIIMVKLTNGVLKIEDRLFEKHCAGEVDLSDKELKKLATSFSIGTFL